MGLAILFAVGPVGLIVGLILGLFRKKIRIISYIILIVLLLILGLIDFTDSGSSDQGIYILIVFLIAACSVLAMLVVEIFRGLIWAIKRWLK